MGIAALFARHLAFGIVVLALAHRARTQQRLVELGLCVGVQHVDRICVLVSRFGARWYGRRGSIAIVTAIYGLGFGGLAVARAHPPQHVGGDSGGGIVCGGCQALCSLNIDYNKVFLNKRPVNFFTGRLSLINPDISAQLMLFKQWF